MKYSFLGYQRPNGKVGVRNYIAVIPSVICSAGTAEKIAVNSKVKGAIAIMHTLGCDQTDADTEQTLRTLAGIGKNPNVAASLVVGLGCECLPASRLEEAIKKEGKLVASLVIQKEGGTTNTIDKGVKIVQRMAKEVSCIERKSFNVNNLSLGTQCGGSDATSGITANPALGVCADKLVENGGIVILAETPEIIGAEHWLVEKATNYKIAEKLKYVADRYEKKLKETGEDLFGKQPGPGNIAGGLSTVEEKALGAVMKGGTTTLNGVLEYSEIPKGKGLYFMDTPGNDIQSNSALLAAGCQVISFTTGKGTPAGTPIAPVIKITGNPYTYNNMKDNIDINAGTIILGKESVEEMGYKIFNEVLAVASGKQTRAEIMGCREFCINRLGPTY